jgi:large subunit ribosomal protein L17
MRHHRKVKKLGRTKAHREAMARNMLRSLIEHERIRTTVAKAKFIRPYIERLIRYAKENTVAKRRLINRWLNDYKLVKKLCEDIAPRFNNHRGGYTRVLKLGYHRPGDSAELALIEFVVRKSKSEQKESAKKK